MSRESSGTQHAGTSGVHVWLVLWRAYDAVSKFAGENIAQLGLGLSDFAVLEAVLHKGPLPVNTIGAKVRLTSGSISVAVDRLERRGLVERRGDPADHRTRLVTLTPKGRELIECAFEAHARAMEDLASRLPDSERATLVRLLKQFGGAPPTAHST
jgi:MarR family 2-MHQ and catechol resistance regulon transcriptional repressor